jgi:xylulokinase
MNIDSKQFDDRLLDATAAGLKHKLLPIEPSTTIAGKIAGYYVQRHGFSPDCDVVLASGDNPCSLIGLGLVEPGHFALSLGTSDTLFACTETPTRSRGKGCVFCSPDGQHYMALLCRSNGSLARKSVCERYFGKEDWDAFGQALKDSPPGNEGKMMLPFFEAEIVPKTAGAVVVRQAMDESDPKANIRALVEAQAMSFKIHAEYMGPPSMLRVTGGASRNEEILRIHADVFNCPVARLATPNSAALGAALRAAYSHRSADRGGVGWREAVDPFTQLTGGIDPDPAAVAVYRDLLERYRAFEAEHTG